MEPSPEQEYGYFKGFSISSIPLAATVDLMVSRIGPIALLLLLVEYFGPIRDTIKSTVATARGIERLERLK